LAILGFHKIGKPSSGGWESWFYIPEAIFIGYLQYLKENDWHVIDLLSFIRGLASPNSLPERAALLTFDDGYKSIRDVALPCLLRFRFPGVLFVPTKFIGGYNDFDIGIEPKEPICDWDDLRELERCGVSVQSHGVSHRSFSELDPVQQQEELLRSKAKLEAGLGKPVEVFAHPYGDEGTDHQELGRILKRAGYRAACLYGGGPISFPIANPYRLTRLAMGPDTDLEEALMSERFIPLT
jgi:peptidoglycan/xylan/chitin deacetylase (PgdA/CDA1 family)